MATIMFVSLKGGVAKTTNAVAVAEGLATLGRRVLVIDADHQCMAGELMVGEQRMWQAEKAQGTLHDLLARMLEDDFRGGFDGYILKGATDIEALKPKLAVLPCSIRIDDFHTNMAKAKRGFKTNDEFQTTWKRRRASLRRWLGENYDHVIVDCPPSIAPQVKFLLSVADAYIVPSVPDRLSVRGALWLEQRLGKLGKNLRGKGLGVLWSLYRVQNKQHKNIVDLAKKGYARFAPLPKPFATVLPNATAIAAAFENEVGQRPASFTAKYSHDCAGLYLDICREIEARLAAKEKDPGAFAGA